MDRNNRKIVLASKSPRRKVLLEQLGVNFEIHESPYEEDMNAKKNPEELAMFLALEKARAVKPFFEDVLIIAADTFIVFDGEFIGKPKDLADAKRILNDFSGKSHRVISSLAILDSRTGKEIVDFGEGRVFFKDLDEEEIDKYLFSGGVLDKAGAYAIQEKAGLFIERIEGDYYSIVGLPLSKLYSNLKRMGVDLLET